MQAEVGITVAFTAGLLSFLSPCVLPLVPSYVTFLTGLSLEEAQQEGARRAALIHSILFVTGFTMIFMALGATATALGALLIEYRDWIARIGGVLIIIFGLYLLGVFNISALSRERRVHLADKPVGYLGSVFVGIAFGAGWTPCIGPMLSAIFTMAATAEDFGRGMFLLFAYSMGLAVPFLLAALLLRRFVGLFSRFRGAVQWASRIAGILLIVVGILMVTNYFTILSTMLQPLTPEWVKKLL